MPGILDELSAARWLQVVNNDPDDVPAYGVMQIVGWDDDTGVWQVQQPDSDDVDPGMLVVNGPIPIDSGDQGQGTHDWPIMAATDGPASVGDDLGTAAGQWELAVGNAGFKCWKDITGCGSGFSGGSGGGDQCLAVVGRSGVATGSGGSSGSDSTLLAVLLRPPTESGSGAVGLWGFDGSGNPTTTGGGPYDPPDIDPGWAWAPLGMDANTGRLVVAFDPDGGLSTAGTNYYHPARCENDFVPSVGDVVRLRINPLTTADHNLAVINGVRGLAGRTILKPLDYGYLFGWALGRMAIPCGGDTACANGFDMAGQGPTVSTGGGDLFSHDDNLYVPKTGDLIGPNGTFDAATKAACVFTCNGIKNGCYGTVIGGRLFPVVPAQFNMDGTFSVLTE